MSQKCLLRLLQIRFLNFFFFGNNYSWPRDPNYAFLFSLKNYNVFYYLRKINNQLIGEQNVVCVGRCVK